MDALVGWIGSLLGAVALLLALSTLPDTWSSQHHAVYVLLWVVVVACLAIVVILPLRHLPHGVRFRWSVWRTARHYRKNPPGAYVTGVSNPVSATGSRDFMFSTNREDRRVIPTDIRPAALRMRVPVADTILASSLPYRVRRYGKTVFEVREFLSTGFVISDQSPGLMVQGEIFYSELVPVRDLPAQSPPAPLTPPDSPSGSLPGRRALRVALTRTGD